MNGEDPVSSQRRAWRARGCLGPAYRQPGKLTEEMASRVSTCLEGDVMVFEKIRSRCESIWVRGGGFSAASMLCHLFLGHLCRNLHLLGLSLVVGFIHFP